MKNKLKQISFISSIVILVSGTIGSGIFFKNGFLFSLAHGSMALVLTSWIVAGIGMISLGFGIGEMALISKGRKGILEWTKNFLPTKLGYHCKNFIQLFFIPIILFAVPIYEVKALNQAGLDLTAWQDLILGFVIFLWFAILSFVSEKVGEIFQWIIMIIKFIPLIVLPIWAMTQVGDYDIAVKHDVPIQHGLSGVGGGFMILVAGLSAIAFSFDGFYSVTTLREDMTHPKKLSKVIIFGLIIVTLFYIFLTIGFALGTSKGTHVSMGLGPLSLKIFSVLISLGILGVVNGYSQFGVNIYISLHEEDQSWYTRIWEKTINKTKIFKKRTVAFISFLFLITLIFFILGTIGIYLWDEQDLPRDNYPYHKVGRLISFVDTLTNYKSLLIFTIISLSLFFAIPEIKKEVKSKRKRILLIILSIIGISMIFISGIYTIIESIVDMCGYNGASSEVGLIEFSILLFFITFSIIMGTLEYKSDIKRRIK